MSTGSSHSPSDLHAYAVQVEIKLRLPNKEAHDKVAEALKDSYIETHDQENFFFEGSGKELSKAKVSLRTRFYGVDKKAQITMKVCLVCAALLVV